MPRSMISMLPIAILLVAPATAVAAKKAAAAQVPAAMQQMLACRDVGDDKARLACFDSSVGAFAAAQTRGDVAVVDRAQVQQTRRSLFGFNLPSLSIFVRHDEKGQPRVEDDIKEITAKARAVTQDADGFYVITLEDGARWAQTEAASFGRFPKPGSTVTIRRRALGSFSMSWDGVPGVKARRVG